MLLTDLKPAWAGVLRPGDKSGEGLTFDCPACGPSHRLCVYFENPRDGEAPNDWTNKWRRVGEDFSTLTVTSVEGGAPSVMYSCWHGWIESGKIFSVDKSPLTLPGFSIGAPQFPFVSLSPNQAEQFARDILDRVNKLRSE